MTRSGAAGAAHSSYSPQRRTALLLTGTGTAGAYHAGVLRALHEAGVKLDIAAGRGIGAVGAVFAAVDGGHRLWDDTGFWRGAGAARLYGWSPTLRLLVLAVAAAVAIVAVPITAMAIGLVVYPLDFVLTMVGLSGGGLVAWYVDLANRAFAPTAFPTWLPRLVVLVLGAAGLLALAGALRRRHRRQVHGPWWWRIVPAPLAAEPAIDYVWRNIWDLVRGAAQLREPSRVDLARRYAEYLAENLGQPGFRDLVLIAHDVDAARDLVFALAGDARRRDLIRRPLMADTDRRRAEVFDLAGLSRDHLADALAGALTVPLATDLHEAPFAPEGYWRGETHRLCDRVGSLERLLEEVVDLGAEQVILVSASPEIEGPHTLAAPRLEGRARLGEYVRSSETAVLRDLLRRWTGETPALFVIRPTHNPVGPFDFTGAFDDRSDRHPPLSELMSCGYEDAYHQFIEPVVGADQHEDVTRV